MGFWTPEDPEVVNPSDKDGQANLPTESSLKELGKKIDEELAYQREWKDK